MLQPYMHMLMDKRIVLASTSPCRKQILENIGLKFTVIASQFEENLDKSKFKHPCEYVKANALHKALAVAKELVHDEKLPLVVIGADTVVTMNDTIFEKPKDRQDAFSMLSKFSGKNHTVFTGVALVMPTADIQRADFDDSKRFEVDVFHAGTDVEFDDISSDTIWSYIETGEPLDKAGGYGIQGVGGSLVRSIHGDYFNVMGFPLHLFCKHLLKHCLKIE